MSQPVTVRLSEPYWEELRQIARREQRSISEIGARFILEGLRQARFPYLEFRSFNGERHACVKGGPQVWQVIMVAKDYAIDADATAEHLDLKPELVKFCISYYSAFPDEIDRALDENNVGYERLREMLPGIQLVGSPQVRPTKAAN